MYFLFLIVSLLFCQNSMPMEFLKSIAVRIGIIYKTEEKRRFLEQIPPELTIQIFHELFNDAKNYEELATHVQSIILTSKAGQQIVESSPTQQILSKKVNEIAIALNKEDEEECKHNVSLEETLASRGLILGLKYHLDENPKDINKFFKIEPFNDVHSSLLHIAATFNRKRTLLFLIKKGGNVNLSPASGFTPLHAAARENAVDAATVLIEKGAHINAFYNDKYLPIDLAVEFDSPEMFKLLIEKKSKMPRYNWLDAEYGVSYLFSL